MSERQARKKNTVSILDDGIEKSSSKRGDTPPKGAKKRKSSVFLRPDRLQLLLRRPYRFAELQQTPRTLDDIMWVDVELPAIIQKQHRDRGSDSSGKSVKSVKSVKSGKGGKGQEIRREDHVKHQRRKSVRPWSCRVSSFAVAVRSTADRTDRGSATKQHQMEKGGASGPASQWIG